MVLGAFFRRPQEVRFQALKKRVAESREANEGETNEEYGQLSVPHSTLAQFAKLNSSWLAYLGCQTNEDKCFEASLVKAKGGDLSNLEKSILSPRCGVLDAEIARDEHRKLCRQMAKECPFVVWVGPPPAQLVVLTTVKDTGRRLQWILWRAKHLKIELEKDMKCFIPFLILFRQASVFNDDAKGRSNRLAAAKELWKIWTGSDFCEGDLSADDKTEIGNVNKGLLDRRCKSCDRPLAPKLEDFCSRSCKKAACQHCKSLLIDTGLTREAYEHESKRNELIYRRVRELQPFADVVKHQDLVHEIQERNAITVLNKLDDERQTVVPPCCTPTRGNVSSYCLPCKAKYLHVVTMSRRAAEIQEGKLSWPVCKAAAAEQDRLLASVVTKRIMKCPREENGICPDAKRRRTV